MRTDEDILRDLNNDDINDVLIENVNICYINNVHNIESICYNKITNLLVFKFSINTVNGREMPILPSNTWIDKRNNICVAHDVAHKIVICTLYNIYITTYSQL